MNIILIHSYIPADATQTVFCPTVKDKNGDLSDSCNYRPISLATIFSKIFEHVLLHRLYEYLKTSDKQFGFKRGHSTLMPIFLLKELLRFIVIMAVLCLCAFWMLVKHSTVLITLFYFVN